MSMSRYRSEALKALHEMMKDLHQVGLVDERTMHRFDKGCLKSATVPDSGIITHRADDSLKTRDTE